MTSDSASPPLPATKTNPKLFWGGVVGLIVVLVVASVVIALMGGHPTLRARTLNPEPNSSASTDPIITVNFPRPMNKESVAGSISSVPPVEFETRWTENEVRLLPNTPLLPNTTYTITIGPGVQDSTGTEMGGTISWSFQTREARIAYIRPTGLDGVGELWMRQQGGTDPRRLSVEGQRVTSFDSSPDGSTIVYAVEESATNANLWRVDTENGQTTQVTKERDIYYQAPHYSPSGDMVSVEIRRPSEDVAGELTKPILELRRPLDGSPAGVIYDGEGAVVYGARWSPDGTKIAFMDANARAIGVFNFTTDYRFYPVAQTSLGQQAWSPDGRALVYENIAVSEQGASPSIVTRDLESGTEQIVLADVSQGTEPAWSPDGTTIVYSYAPPAVQSRGKGIWTTLPDGSEPKLLTSEPFINNERPIWSPDGQWILFNLIDPIAGFNAPPTLWAIRPDGTDAHQVSEMGVAAVWVP